MSKKKQLQNAVIINGTIYEMVDDNAGPDAGSECNRCAIRERCSEPVCVTLFDGGEGTRFEKVTD
jgi:hypothetical protein